MRHQDYCCGDDLGRPYYWRIMAAVAGRNTFHSNRNISLDLIFCLVVSDYY
jgi:hypothetical protein